MSIDHRYEIMYYVACTNGNPNGDPDMGNTPRMDPETMQGFISEVSTKRRIRNYIETAHPIKGMEIIIQQGTNINRIVAEVKKAAGYDGADKKNKKAIVSAREEACKRFYDVRTFGAVMSTGPNAGQVRGPVQITFGKSIDPIQPMDMAITRMAAAGGEAYKNLEHYQQWEDSKSLDELRTMGRKQLIPFGLYEVRGFISANLAAETGFDDNDLKVLFEAILNMYEHDRSASKGEMAVVSPLILFKHVGTDSNEVQRSRQAKLGCAPAHKLFELVKVTKKAGVRYPRSYRDYDAVVALDKIPAGVEIGFQSDPYGEPCWGKLPDDETWFREG